MADERSTVRLKPDPTGEGWKPDATGDEALTTIDRAIAEALDVAPSPEFLARVRMRIANEPAPRRVWTTWMPVVVGATAVAAAVMIAGIAPRHGPQVWLKPDTTTDVRLKPDTTAASDVAQISKGVASAFRQTKASQASQVRLKPDGTHRGGSEPEVLVSSAESEALRRLLVRASQRPIVIATLAGDVAETTSDLPPSEIAIEPIKIELLVPQTNGEGVRQ